MLAGLEAGDVEFLPNAKSYLATFTYRASQDATGEFMVDILHDESAGNQTFLVSDFADKLEISGTRPTVVHVVEQVGELKQQETHSQP